MGLQCTKVTPSQPGHRESMQPPRMNTTFPELTRVKDRTTFHITIQSIQLLNFSQTFHKFKVAVEGSRTFQLSSHDFQFNHKIWTTQQHFSTEIEGPLATIASRVVLISIEDKNGNSIDQLKMKLSDLATGPIKHDHLLKNIKSRLLFDCHIDQYLQLAVSLKDFKIHWLAENYLEDSAYHLSLIFSNSQDHVELTRRYEGSQQILQHDLDKLTIKNSQLNQSVIRLNLNIVGYESDHIEYYLPYAKITQNSKYRIHHQVQGVVEKREIARQEELFLQGEKVGTVTYTLSLSKSKLYVEQMDCVIFSENGIVTTTPTDYDLQQKELTRQVLQGYYNRIRSGSDYGMTDLQFMKIMQELFNLIKEGKQFHVGQDLFQLQNLILDFMLELEDNLEENKVVRNQYVWNALSLLLQKKVMNLRYFGIIHEHEYQLKYALKYYKLIVNVLIKVVRFICNGISFKEVRPLQKFVAFAYFRFNWVQDQIIYALSKKSDPIISQDKIDQIGASCRVKSPSKSYIYDWQTNVFNLIRTHPDYMVLKGKLDKAVCDNPNWAGLLFDREYQQLFYGLFNQLWDQAEIFLNNSGRIMWQYFPRYGDILCLFFGEMNDSGILDYSSEMTKCNMKLIKNEKLLNTFMMLIFPKTCLYETYSVIKCLDLINCYFFVILEHHKSIPIDFNYNYFYTGVRCILQSNHSILLQMMLSTLYKYYNIFSKEFKETLNHYILNHVFNPLFMHWSQQVRSLFHLLLNFKIAKTQINNPQITPKMSFSRHEEKSHHFQAINEYILQLREHDTEKKSKKESKEYYQQMKDKLRQKKLTMKRKPSIESFDSTLSTPAKTIKNSSDTFMGTPILAKRKWSVGFLGPHQHQRSAPTQKELSYLGLSLKEFDDVKKEKFPDNIVQQRSKMLQLNVDQ